MSASKGSYMQATGHTSVSKAAAIYDAAYVVLPLLLSRLADIAHIEIKPIYEDLMAIVKSLLTKSVDWSYEKE